MKTLDEVIKAMDWCTDLDQSGCNACPYADSAQIICFKDDALHYLKEYRKLDSIDAIAFPEEDNPPLTWDELKQMEGKPVWVDPISAKALHTPGWGLVGKTSFTTWEGVECCSIVKVGVTYALPVAEYGTKWQAYRKERS